MPCSSLHIDSRLSSSSRGQDPNCPSTIQALQPVFAHDEDGLVQNSPETRALLYAIDQEFMELEEADNLPGAEGVLDAEEEGDPSEEGHPVPEGDPEVEEDKEEEVASTPPASINVQAAITEDLNFIFSPNTRAEYRKRRGKESHVASPRPQPTRGASGEVGTKTKRKRTEVGHKKATKARGGRNRG